MKKAILWIMFLSVLMLAGCSKEVSKEKALVIANNYVKSTETKEAIKLITNFDSPTIEETVLTIPEAGIDGKRCWAVTYTSTFDALLGPDVIYIDIHTGEILFRSLRY